MKTSAHGSERRRADAGYAMVIVMVFVTLSSALVAEAYDRMHQLFVFEETSDRLPSTSDGIQEALGAGLARLQTGEPTVNGNDRYQCDLTLRDSAGDVVKYQLTYTKLTDNEWSLRARPAAAALPACPASFTDIACPAPL